MSDLRERSLPEIPELPAEDTIRVLQVRPRMRAPVPLPTMRPMPAPTTAAPRLAFVAKPPITPTLTPAPAPTSAPPVLKPRKRERSLEETLDDLQSYALELESDDTGSTTGVRHLRVELDKRRK